MKHFFLLFMALVASTVLLASNVITYTASNKLNETTSRNDVSGLHTKVFNVSITNHSFSNGTGTITFAGEVTSIGNYAFYRCSSLTSITIPSSVTTIEDFVFDGCTSLPIEDNLRYADTYLVEAADKSLSTYTIKPDTKWIGAYAFHDCSSLTSITIPNSVRSFGRNAFSGCTSLSSITIPISVTNIGYAVFANCTSLKSVIIPHSVTCIDTYAFYHCTKLTSITIPNSVTSVKAWAFYDCTSLTSITCYATTPPTCGSLCFYEVDKSIPLYVPAESINAYKAADQWKDFTNIQAIPTALDEADSQKSKVEFQKVMIDGRMYILREGKMYDAFGEEVR